ncbi:MAG: bifunctional pyr operon transcriptional regulator/uracil phosphoribosyltransferase PyrR [Candidatus Izemoplasmataceae bacterium]|jgi:pyrimidine operon attenuation protein / uracil phosphoribosyltransferase|uniref:bifunctional pyr operon transcriptional regulator/uracil phosphoribosyltransferase PyrR n=1 Tax=Liberiplasma polymorphum TaxID=3374570 RepID=UPI00377571D8
MKVLFDYIKVERTLKRMTHEILERTHKLDDVVIIGIKKSGIPLAKMIQENLLEFEGITVPNYDLDISFYRDDEKKGPLVKLDVDLTNKHVILVDDVLFTGRTARAAMDAVVDLGRPSKMQLAVLIDRGHRELPIRADYVGKNIPTQLDEKIIVDIVNQKGVMISKENE